MDISVYALKLDGDKYYVGKVKGSKINPTELLDADTKWTDMHPPQEVYRIYTGCDDYDEDKITIKYMAKHGVDSTRGGSFTRVELHPGDLKCIQKMIKTAGGRVELVESAPDTPPGKKPVGPAKSATPSEDPMTICSAT